MASREQLDQSKVSSESDWPMMKPSLGQRAAAPSPSCGTPMECASSWAATWTALKELASTTEHDVRGWHRPPTKVTPRESFVVSNSSFLRNRAKAGPYNAVVNHVHGQCGQISPPSMRHSLLWLCLGTLRRNYGFQTFVT